MNRLKTIIGLTLLMFGFCCCTDSEIDEQFTFSMTDRTATFNLSVSVTSIATDYQSSSQSFNISSSDSWEVSTSAAWISFMATSGTGNGSVNFTIQENPDENERTASILVTGVRSGMTRTVTVTQTGKTLSVETTAVEFDYSGGVKTINVQADGHFSVQNSTSWLSCEQSESAIKITAQPNTEIDTREATISVTLNGTSLSKQIQITQYGGSGLTFEDFDEEQKW